MGNEAPSRSSASLAPSSLVEGPPSMEDPRLDHSASSLPRLASYLFPHSRFLPPPRVFSSAALLPPPPPPALLGPALVTRKRAANEPGVAGDLAAENRRRQYGE